MGAVRRGDDVIEEVERGRTQILRSLQQVDGALEMQIAAPLLEKTARQLSEVEAARLVEPRRRASR